MNMRGPSDRPQKQIVTFLEEAVTILIKFEESMASQIQLHM
jgi:hypothetical protein